jgi:hypothetical protein
MKYNLKDKYVIFFVTNFYKYKVLRKLLNIG